MLDTSQSGLVRFYAPGVLVKQIKRAAKAQGTTLSEYMRTIARDRVQDDLDRLARIEEAAP